MQFNRVNNSVNNNSINNKECLHFLVVSGVDTCICVSIPCALGLYSGVQEAFSGAFCSVAAHRPGSSPPTLFPFFFPLFQQYDGCLFLLLHGWVTRICQP